MKLLIGLGNPGEKYENTRHNVGFSVVDRLRSTAYGDTPWEEMTKFSAVVCKPSAHDIILAKPQTFMNESGQAVNKLANYYKIDISNIWIIHDDLDIKLGQFKIQKGFGPKLHYGVNSIEKELGREDFWRVRVGVDNRTNNKQQRTKGEPSFAKASEGKEYVLQNFSTEERKIIDGVIIEVVQEIVDSIMNDEL